MSHDKEQLKSLVKTVEGEGGTKLHSQLSQVTAKDWKKFKFYCHSTHKSDLSVLLVGEHAINSSVNPLKEHAKDYKEDYPEVLQGRCTRDTVMGVDTVVFYVKRDYAFTTKDALIKKVKKVYSAIGDVLVTAKPELDEDAPEGTSPVPEAKPAPAAASPGTPAQQPAATGIPAGKTVPQMPLPGVGAKAVASALPATVESKLVELHAGIEAERHKLTLLTQTRENAEFEAGKATTSADDANQEVVNFILKYQAQHPGDPEGWGKSPKFQELQAAFEVKETKAIAARAEARRLEAEQAQQFRKNTDIEQQLGLYVDRHARDQWPAEQAGEQVAAQQKATLLNSQATVAGERADDARHKLMRLRGPELATAKIAAANADIQRLTAQIAEAKRQADKLSWGRKKRKADKAAGRTDAEDLEKELGAALARKKQWEKALELAQADLAKPGAPRGDQFTALYQQQVAADLERTTRSVEARRSELDAAHVAAGVAEEQAKEADRLYLESLGDLGGHLVGAENARQDALDDVRAKQDAVNVYYVLGDSDADLAAAVKDAEAEATRLEEEFKAADKAALELAGKIKALQTTPGAEQKEKLDRALAELEANATACKKAWDDQVVAAELMEKASAKLKANNIDEARKAQAEADSKVGEAVDAHEKARAALRELDKDGEFRRLRAAPPPLSTDDAKKKEKFAKDVKLQEALAKVTRTREAVQDARKKQVEAQEDVKTVCRNAAAADQAALNAATKKAGKADEELQQLRRQETAILDDDDTVRGRKQAADDAAGTELRAKSAEIDAEGALNAAKRDEHVAKFFSETAAVRAQCHTLFAPFQHLTDESFDIVHEGKRKRKKVDDVLKLMKQRPVLGNDGQPLRNPDGSYQLKENPNFEKDALAARDLYVKLVEQDRQLEQMDAPLEDRKRAFEGVPEPLWPPMFRKQLDAYREVELLFAEEKEEERRRELARSKIKKLLEGRLGKAWAAIEPAVDAFFDAVNLTSDVLEIFGETGVGMLDEAGAAAGKGMTLLSCLGDAFAAFAATPEALEEAEGKDTTEVLVEFVLASLKAGSHAGLGAAKTAKTTLGILGKVGVAVDTAGLTGGALDLVISSIELGHATYQAGKAISLAAREGRVLSDVKKGEDNILKMAVGNAHRSSALDATQKSIHAGTKGVATLGAMSKVAGTAAAAGSYGTGFVVGMSVGVGLQATAKGLEYANKFAFQCVDWADAASAQAAMDKAAAGSQRAMQEVFKFHQKYASMYILLRARDGDRNCLKLCVLRGLDRGQVLDSEFAFRVLREQFLNRVGKDDEVKTLKDQVLGKWDAMCKGARSVKRLVSKDKPAPAPTGGARPGFESGPAGPPSPQALAEIVARAEAIWARVQLDADSFTHNDGSFCAQYGGMADVVMDTAKAQTPFWNKLSASERGKMFEDADRLKQVMQWLSAHRPSPDELRPVTIEPTIAEERLRRRAAPKKETAKV
jgi:hypothetical protein